jgi:hypothetical protein
MSNKSSWVESVRKTLFQWVDAHATFVFSAGRGDGNTHEYAHPSIDTGGTTVLLIHEQLSNDIFRPELELSLFTVAF